MKKFPIVFFLPVLILVLSVQDSGQQASAHIAAAAAGSLWESIGPYGGNIQSLKANPSDPNEIFAAAVKGQVCRSPDGGRSWTLVAVIDVGAYSVYDLALSPSDPKILYVTSYRGVFKSVDRGAHWTEAPFPDRCTSTGNIWVNPLDPDRILVAGSFGGCAALLKSDNGGVTWTPKTLACATYASCSFIAVDPFNAQVVYASASYSTGGLDGPYISNLYKTTDGGDSWRIVFGGTAPQAVAIDPANPSRIYIGMSGGIYRSSDGGQTWTKNNGEAAARRLAVDPENPQIVYGGSSAAVYRSVNAGADWTKIPIGIEGSCTSLLVSGAKVLFGSNTGVFRSEDGGNAWSASISGMNAWNVPAFAASPSSPRTVYAAAEIYPGSCILFKTVDGGLNWKRLPEPNFSVQSDSRIVVNPLDAETLWVVARDLWKSTDGGATWRWLTARPVIDPLTDMAVGQKSPDHLFVCGKALDHQSHFFTADFGRSADGGMSWTYIPVTTTKSSASVIAVDLRDENVIYVGGEKGGAGALFMSLDGGAKWTEIGAADFGSRPVEAIGVDPRSGSRIHVGTEAGFYRSENRGTTWTKTASFPVNGIAVHPLSPNEVYAGGSAGIYRSSDGGETWSDMNSGLVAIRTNAVDFVAADQRLYVATPGGLNRRTIVLPRIFSPLNFSGTKVLNRSLFRGETINVLKWTPNPKNEGIVSYRIYSVEGETWTKMLAEVLAGTIEFRDRNVSADMTSTYALVAVNNEGREGEPAYVTVR